MSQPWVHHPVYAQNHHMKKFVLLAYGLLPFLTQAQVKLFNSSLTDTSLSYVYMGIANKIEVKGVKGNQLRLVSTSGQIKPDYDNGNVFLYQNMSAGVTTMDTFRLYEGEKLLLYRVFEKRQMARPQLSTAHSLDTVMNKAKLEADPVLAVYRNDFYENNFYILRFQLDICPLEGEATIYGYTEGNRLTSEQLEKIKSLRSGDRIWIHHIFANCPDCVMKSKMRDVYIRIE